MFSCAGGLGRVCIRSREGAAGNGLLVVWSMGF